MKKKQKPSPYIEEEINSNLMVQEPVAAYACEAAALPSDTSFARVVDGVLQVTPDIEDEIAAVERGETVSMDEFKTMFSKWLDFSRFDTFARTKK